MMRDCAMGRRFHALDKSSPKVSLARALAPLAAQVSSRAFYRRDSRVRLLKDDPSITR